MLDMDLMMLVPDNESKPAPRLEHVCEVPVEEDELFELIVGNSLLARFRRWVVRQCMLSVNHPGTRACMKSTAAINYEKSRHIRSYPYMIHPFSRFRCLWEMIMLFFTFVVLCLMPYLVAFYLKEHEELYLRLLIIDIVFLTDIVLWFLTGHYDYSTKLVVLDPRIVAQKYLKGFFTLDLLSAIPLEILAILIAGHKTTVWYYTCLDLFKIVRLRTIFIYGKRFCYNYRIPFQTHKSLETIIIFMLIVHWSACLEYYIPLVISRLPGTSENRESWILSDYMKKKNTGIQKYLQSLNRATIALTNSAHFLIVKTPEDIILNLLLAIIGRIGLIYILGQILQLVTTLRSRGKGYSKLLQQLHEYMRYKELPLTIQKRILAYFDYTTKRGFERERHIMTQVSSQLREELMFHNYKKFVENIEFLRHLPHQAIARIITSLRSEVYLINDVIIKAGTPGDKLFFIVSGTVAVYTSGGKEICHLENGAHFGEVALVMENEHRVATVVAIETCELYFLTRDDFQEAIAAFPNILSKLQRIALQILDKAPVLEDTLNRDYSMPSIINISNIIYKKKE